MTPRAQESLKFTFGATDTTSNIIPIKGYTHGGLVIPTISTATTLYFQVYDELLGTWDRVSENGRAGTTYGADISFAIGSVSNIRVRLPDEVFGFSELRLELNAAEGACTFGLSLQT